MQPRNIAMHFVEARLSATGIPTFPGQLPATLAEAYQIQTEAIRHWPDEIAGWKVGRITPPQSGTLGADRFIGPIFSRSVTFTAGAAPFPAIRGGFAAFEAEIAITLGEDAPANKDEWTAEDAMEITDSMHIAAEVAGSPLASIDALGSLAAIAAFGNNNGLVMGPAISGWRDLRHDRIACTTLIDTELSGTGTAATLPGGPFAGVAFALAAAARLGRPLRRGEIVSTGALTGVHSVAIDQRCTADFGPFGKLDCTVVAARAFQTASAQRR